MLIHHNVWFNNDTPLIELVYHSKLLEKDLRKAAEKQMAENMKRNHRGIRR